jgi:hypothetical protein
LQQAGGAPLPGAVQKGFEERLGEDVSQVRIHTDDRSATTARQLNAKAFTVGKDVVFGKGQFQPDTASGKRLIAHELTHVRQQRAASPVIQRQEAASDEASDEASNEEGKDVWAGTAVSELVVSLARGRVGFRTRLGMLLGDISTDLVPGQYDLKPNLALRRWEISGPNVKSGLRFDVTLDEANPWTLTYPEKLTLTVSPGDAKASSRTWGEMVGNDNQLVDPLWLYEGTPPEEKPRPISGIDDFESAHYDLSYRSEGGNLSKWLVVHYRDGSVRNVHIDSVTNATPRLWAAKSEALKIMEEYNTEFILNVFPTVFFILTLAVPGGAPAARRTSYVVGRRSFPRPNATQNRIAQPSDAPATARQSETPGAVDPSVPASPNPKVTRGTPPQPPPATPAPLSPEATELSQLLRLDNATATHFVDGEVGQILAIARSLNRDRRLGLRNLLRDFAAKGRNSRKVIETLEGFENDAARNRFLEGRAEIRWDPNWRGTPQIETGNLDEGWLHIEARHITGTAPGGDLFAAGTTRAELERAAAEVVASGQRVSAIGRRIQTFVRRIVVHGKSDRVMVTVDTSDGRVITIFPERGGH